MRHVVRDGPQVATTSLMAFTTGAFYLFGGTAAALTTVPAWSSGPDVTLVALLGLCLMAAAAGAGLLRWGRLLPRWAFHVVVGAASLMLAAGVVLSRDDQAALGLAAVFVFCAVDILYFFHGRQALAQAAVLLGAITASLVARGTHPSTVLALLLVQVAVLIVIGRLVDRAADGVRDPLTGLPNRRGFDERLDAEVSGARRNGALLSVALVDVDHFKGVNDRDGHAGGDALLRRLAGAWSDALPAGVHLTRQGGDEFAVVAAGLGASGLAAVCEHLHTLAAPATVSIGVADLREGENSAVLVRRADTALYAAKAAGRACTRTATADTDTLAADLAHALAHDEVDVALQPLVDPATGEVTAVEALARWEHPRRGPIPPDVFVALAERTDLVHALGARVLTKACEDAVRLRRYLGRDVLLTVNTSGHQLAHPTFVDDLLGTLARTGWPASHLVVEVTESSIQIASAPALAALRRVRAAGVAVAIDDFGTGYSAFSHLDTLPADYLKLDAAFTAGTTTSTRRRAMLGALLDLCRHLDLTVVAEGVETAAQAELLTAMGCPLVQGYHYARPARLADRPDWASPPPEAAHGGPAAVPRPRGPVAAAPRREGAGPPRP